MRRILAAMSIMIMLLLPWAALASNCSISTVGLLFGNYNVFSPTALTSNASITYKCNGVVPLIDRVTIDLSQGNAGTYASRTLSRGTEVLNYNLYLDAAMTQVWGNGTGGTQRYGPTSPPNNQDVTTTIFGRIPSGQDVTVGNYSDTIVATINF
jgi:spore coat protein U-like protein